VSDTKEKVDKIVDELLAQEQKTQKRIDAELKKFNEEKQVILKEVDDLKVQKKNLKNSIDEAFQAREDGINAKRDDLKVQESQIDALEQEKASEVAGIQKDRKALKDNVARIDKIANERTILFNEDRDKLKQKSSKYDENIAEFKKEKAEVVQSRKDIALNIKLNEDVLLSIKVENDELNKTIQDNKEILYKSEKEHFAIAKTKKEIIELTKIEKDLMKKIEVREFRVIDDEANFALKKDNLEKKEIAHKVKSDDLNALRDSLNEAKKVNKEQLRLISQEKIKVNNKIVVLEKLRKEK